MDDLLPEGSVNYNPINSKAIETSNFKECRSISSLSWMKLHLQRNNLGVERFAVIVRHLVD